MRLSGDVMSIAEDVWNDTGGGDTDFAVAEGVLAYRERERNLGSWSGWIVPASRLGVREGAPITFTRGCRRTAGEPSWRSSIRTPRRIRSGCWISCAARGRSSSRDPRRAIFRSGRPTAARSSSAPIGAGRGACLQGRPRARARTRSCSSSDDQQLATDWSRDGRFVLYQTVRLHAIGHLGAADGSAGATVCRRQQRTQRAAGAALTRRTLGGLRVGRRVAARKSGFRAFRRHRKSGRSRPRVEASRSGGATVESCSTSRGI